MTIAVIIKTVRARFKLPGLLLASAVCLAAVASPAAATGTGAITGTVTDTAAVPAPVMSICVEAMDASTGKTVATTDTNASGQYTFSALSAGSYKVHFTDCTGKGYVPQYYNNKATYAAADSVSVGTSTVSGINAKMVMGAKITGTVKSHAGLALNNMCVAADSGPGAVVSMAYTNSGGQYTIRGLPTGSYKIDFWDCAGTDFVQQYYNNQSSYSNANSVSVTAPSVTSGINADLYMGGKVTGTVTNNAAVPAPLSGMCVSVMTTTGTFVMGQTTPASGQYSIAGVPIGTYKIVFGNCSGGAYVTQYYNNKPTLAAANTVSVTRGVTTAGLNAKMVPAGKISGTVTNASATPLAKVCVNALDAATGTVIENAITNAKGQYTIASLAAGSYKVDFVDCGAGGYVGQYYKNQTTLAAANPLSISSGVTTTGIDAKLVHT